MTEVQPSVSAAGNLFISAFLRAIAVTPKAKVMVTIAGKPSGIAATAKETEARNDHSSGNPNVFYELGFAHAMSSPKNKVAKFIR